MSLKKRITLGLAVLSIYCLVYLLLSLVGEYQVSSTGENKYSAGFRIPDVHIWTPKYFSIGINQNSRNKLAWFFFPLHELDRAFVNKDQSHIEVIKRKL